MNDRLDENDAPAAPRGLFALDHVHVSVSDREAAADWYGRVLGLMRDGRLSRWAEDPTQPLFIGSAVSRSCLALFQLGTNDASGAGDRTVGFRATGEAFLDFLDRLGNLGLRRTDGDPLTAADVVDHGAAWSVYFLDLDANRIEVTTYDYDLVTKGFIRYR